MAGLDEVDAGQDRQAFGECLGQRSGQRRRRGGAGLSGGEQVDGHAGVDLGDHRADGVLGVAQRRYDERVVGDAEGSFGEGAGAAEDGVVHVDDLVDVLGLEERRADRLRGAHGEGVGGVDVEVAGPGHVAGYEGADVEVDVFEGVDEAGHVVDVLEVGGPVRAGLVFPDRHGGAGGAEVDPVAANLDGAVVVEAVPGELLGGHGDGLLDEGAGEVEAVVVEPTAGGNDDVDELGDGSADAVFLEEGEGGVVDGAAFAVREGLVPAAGLAGADGPVVLAGSGGPGGDPGGASSCSSAFVAHGVPLQARRRSLVGSWAAPSRTVAVWRSFKSRISKVAPGAAWSGAT